MVYTSTSIALAALEYAVHTVQRPLDSVLLEIEVAVDSLETIESRVGGALPQNWSYAELQTRDLGTAWLREKSSLLLEVPSVIIPRERNVLMNPSHADAHAARIVSVEPFFFDPRIFGGRGDIQR